MAHGREASMEFEEIDMSRMRRYEGIDFNVYCDESCHLEHDGATAMSLGAIWCSKAKVPLLNKRIAEIKSKHDIPKKSEVKWTKASPCNCAMYLDLVDFFFDDDDLNFRALVVPDKKRLKHKEYGQTHNEWYYKMYFDMLKTIFHPSNHYYVYIDIKDTHSGENARKLEDVCANDKYDFNHKIVRRIQPIRSEEVGLMQLVDILTGAVAYRHNHPCLTAQNSPAKVSIVNRIIRRSECSLMKSTLPSAKKFNLFVWEADWNMR